MVAQNHFRWDFIGLSTDTKPTPADSEKVTDGSTYYTSDNSKLYVWYKDQWYEKEVEGGGGGGTTNFNNLSNRPKYNGTEMTGTTDIPEVKTYTAGTNVNISSGNVISATDTTYSAFVGTDGTAAGTAGLVPAPATTDSGKFLKADGTWDTAGGTGPTVVQTTGTSTTAVMSQKAVTDALADVGGFTTLTTEDYNWNSSTGTTGTPNCVALWLLPSGIYKGPADSSIDIRATRTQDYSMGTGFSSYAIVKEYEGTNNRAIVTYFDGTTSSIIEYYSIDENGQNYSTKRFPDVVQSTGTSTTNVMSQKAVTDALASAGGGAKLLSAADYNYPVDNPSGIAFWLLDEGQYKTDGQTSLKLYVNNTSAVTTSDKYGLVVITKASSTISKGCYIYTQGGETSTRMVTEIDINGSNARTKILPTYVIDSLTNTSTTNALSANQGKVLKDLIDALTTRVSALEGN